MIGKGKRSLFLRAGLAAAVATATVPADAQNLGASDVAMLPASEPTLMQRYGAEPLQFGELRLPKGKGPFPVAVIIHGGCWTKGYATLSYMAPLASALADDGIATWNIEYRQAGDEGGGWPGTFLDWGAGIDHLRLLAQSHALDLSNLVIIGHSAGAHGALWAAGRHRLPASSEISGADPLKVRAAVALDGPTDLIGFQKRDVQTCRKPVIAPFMGGTPEEQPQRYAAASPAMMLPLRTSQYLVSSSAVFPAAEAEAHRRAAVAAGDAAEALVLTTGGHFNLLAPGTPEWARVRTFLRERVFKRE